MTILAHRGLTAAAGDNSELALAAVAQAVADGLPLGIEMDVRAAADQLVLNHDPFEWGVPLFDVALADLRTEMGANAPIPLARGLELLDGVPVINIELKEQDTAKQTLDIVVRHCEETGRELNTIMFVSFIPREIAEVKQLDPRFRTGILMEGVLTSKRPTPDRVCLTLDDDVDGEATIMAETMWKVADHVHADILSPHWTRLNKRVIDLATERQKQLVPWTVNNGHLMRALLTKPEVLHIVTDFPEKIFPALTLPQPHRKYGSLVDSD